MTWVRMGYMSAIRGVGVRRWLALGGLAAAPAACSFILDHSASQCQTNADCARFGGRPSCQSGVCVDLGQGPQDCFYGTPSQPADFYNQCSTASCGSFDDCALLGVCDGGIGPPAVPPPAPMANAGSDGGAAAPAGMDIDPPNCVDPTQGRPKAVYITGSSNFPPLLNQLAPLIVQQGFTPVFLTTSSCTGVASMLSPEQDNHVIRDPPTRSKDANFAEYFDGMNVVDDMYGHPCLLGEPQTVDIGESDVFSEDCDTFGPATMYTNVTESFGPIQAMAFIVNQASSARTISQAAAHEVFGLGGDANPNLPWTVPARFFVRNKGTGTQQMIAAAIGVPAGQFWGVDTGTAAKVANAVAALNGTEAAQGIGIISVDSYDQHRDTLRALAYRASPQECAYLPDSDVQSFDKRNVRDGHYPIWGPIHFYSSPGDDAATAFLDVAVIEAVSDPTMSQLPINAFIQASLVPLCAMQVQRDSEVGPLSAFTPKSCGCYFEAYAAQVLGGQPFTTPSGCTPCGSGLPACPSDRPSCNLGFCEAQ